MSWKSKPKKTDCNCRRRVRGNPKYGNGPCYHDMRDQRRAVVERIAGKRLAQRWLVAARLRELDDVDA